MPKQSLLTTVIILWCISVRDLKAAKLVCSILEGTSDCVGKEHLSISRYFDTTHLNVDWRDDGDMVIDGYSMFLVDLDPNLKVHLKSRVQKNQSGRWVNIGVNKESRDFCSDLIDPKQIWSGMTRDFNQTKEELCPPKKGTKFPIINKVPSFTVLDVPYFPGIDGKYRVNMDFTSPELQICLFVDIMCLKKMN